MESLFCRSYVAKRAYHLEQYNWIKACSPSYCIITSLFGYYIILLSWIVTQKRTPSGYVYGTNQTWQSYTLLSRWHRSFLICLFHRIEGQGHLSMYITSNLKAVNRCLHSIKGYDAYPTLQSCSISQLLCRCHRSFLTH